MSEAHCVRCRRVITYSAKSMWWVDTHGWPMCSNGQMAHVPLRDISRGVAK